MNVRPAKLTDITDITRLHNQALLDNQRIREVTYASQVQHRGFLVDAGVIDWDIAIKNAELFLIAEDNSEVMGFLEVNKQVYVPEDAPNCIWITDALKQHYFADQTVRTLHSIVVHLDFQQQGVARELYFRAEQILKTRSISALFSIVTTGPLLNCPSLIVHTKLGFQIACVTLPIDLFNLTNYTSVLLHKQL